MDNVTVEAISFAKDRALRDAYIDRVDVLNKVKTLMLIPDLEMVTTREIADFYEIDVNTVNQCVHYHRKEIALDGVKTLTFEEFLHLEIITAKETRRGLTIVTLKDGRKISLNPYRTTFYTARAMLRIGLLLKKSAVAQEVRTQLLNTRSHATSVQRTYEIDEEKTLLLAIVMSGTDLERAESVANYREYTQRFVHRVAELEAETHQLSVSNNSLTRSNEALAQSNAALNQENDAYSIDEMLWDDRTIIGRLVASYGARAYPNCNPGKQRGYAWSQFYRELSFNHGISLEKRKSASKRKGAYKNGLLDYVRPDEWVLLVRKAYAMCRRIGCHLRQSLANDVVYARIRECAKMKAEDLPSANLEEPLGLPEPVEQ